MTIPQQQTMKQSRPLRISINHRNPCFSSLCPNSQKIERAKGRHCDEDDGYPVNFHQVELSEPIGIHLLQMTLKSMSSSQSFFFCHFSSPYCGSYLATVAVPFHFLFPLVP